MQDVRLANILGSTAVAVADAIDSAVDEAAGHGAAAPAALTALRQHPRSSVDDLARVLGLSHSGTVRLVDRLETDGLVRRGPAADARAVALELTPRGSRRVAGVARAREDAVAAFLVALDAGEQQELTRLLEKLVGAGMEDWTGVRHRCRLCDLDACHAGGGRCPLDERMELLAG
jgi:DNA-binding MarR family transcriptional regulator